MNEQDMTIVKVPTCNVWKIIAEPLFEIFNIGEAIRPEEWQRTKDEVFPGFFRNMREENMQMPAGVEMVVFTHEHQEDDVFMFVVGFFQEGFVGRGKQTGSLTEEMGDIVMNKAPILIPLDEQFAHLN